MSAAPPEEDDVSDDAENRNPQTSSDHNMVLGEGASRSLRHDSRKGRNDGMISPSIERKKFRSERILDDSLELMTPGKCDHLLSILSKSPALAKTRAKGGLQKITAFFSPKSPEVSKTSTSMSSSTEESSSESIMIMDDVPSSSSTVSISETLSKVEISPSPTKLVSPYQTRSRKLESQPSSPTKLVSPYQTRSVKPGSSSNFAFKRPSVPAKERPKRSMSTRSSLEKDYTAAASSAKPERRKTRTSKPNVVPERVTSIIDRLRSNTPYHMPDEQLEHPDEPDEIPLEEQLLKVPTMIVVDPSINSSTRYNERIEIVKEFVANLPKGCPEARRTSAVGSWSRKKERRKMREKWEERYPGIPDKKCGYWDEQKMKHDDAKKLDSAETKEDRERILKEFSDKAWIVQALFECPDNPEYSRVLYEGWSSECMSNQRTDETDATAPKIMKVRRIREAFLAKVREEAEVKAREMVAGGLADDFDSAFKTVFVNPRIESLHPTHRFWLYRDLEYFHTKHQEEHLLGPIWYMSMSDPEQPPPCYTYTPVNIVKKDAFEKLRSSMASMSTKELISTLYSRRTFQPSVNETCSNPKECRCNQRFNILYGRDSGQDRRVHESYQPIKNLKHDSNGLLDLRNFQYHDLRVIMECSDECGCNHDCPRRRLQQGQTKPMVVYFEGLKGFGLRAAESFKKGELICEYTGEMFLFDTPHKRKPVSPHAHHQLTVSLSEETVEEEEPSAKEDDVEVEVEEEEEDEPKKAAKKPPKKKKNTSYQAGFSVMNDEIGICAQKFGNIARFINHSCKPNTAFFEVHSRRYVADPLIPRVAVYATKDISLGEEITIAYWDPSVERIRTSNPCRCGSEKCMKYLPH